MSLCCSAAKAEAKVLSPAIRIMASPLAQKMFLSYLEGSISAGTIGEIVKAVLVHPTHAAIVEWVQRKVQEHIDQTGGFPGEDALREVSSNAIDTFTMASPAGQLAEAPVSIGGRAYFSGPLQAVIGGINDITLSDSKILTTTPTEMTFRGAYTIRDFYDFDNDRSMFPVYDKYRKELTKIFAVSCPTCVAKFHADSASAPVNGGNAKTGPLDAPQIFTCYMFALEKNGCTSSLLWDAEIPYQIKVRASRAAPNPPPLPNPLPPKPLPGPTPNKPPTPPVGPGSTYVVKNGDNLSKIAKIHYGDERLWPKIYNANKGVIGGNPNLIHSGQRLVIPPK